MSPLEDILYQKYTKNEMAHFYILAGTEKSTDTCANELICKLFSKIMDKNITQEHLSNHPDILFLTTEASSYTVEEHREIFHFLNYKALTLKRKFIIIPQAQLISENFANKLLKVLEEPPIDCTFILFNLENNELLPTISSRGIKIRLEASRNSQDTHDKSLYAEIYQEFIQDNSLTGISEKLAKKPELERGYFNYLASQIKELPSPNNLQAISSLIDELKLAQEEQVLNSSKKNRIYRLLTLTKQVMQIKINDQNTK
jgi:DNA polymerase III delta prime subunit